MGIYPIYIDKILAWDLVLWFAFLDEFLDALDNVFVELDGPAFIYHSSITKFLLNTVPGMGYQHPVNQWR